MSSVEDQYGLRRVFLRERLRSFLYGQTSIPKGIVIYTRYTIKYQLRSVQMNTDHWV